jgi:hypothetical protein
MTIKKNVTFSIELTRADMHALIKEIEMLYPMFASEDDIEQIHNLLELKNELVLADQNDD